MSRTKNVLRNVRWGMVETILAMIIPFIMRTIMIYMLGELFVGLNGLFRSIIQIFNVAELGISTSIVYSMYRPVEENNVEEICALLNLYKKCYRYIGLIVLGSGILITPYLDKIILGETPPNINIKLLYIINLVNTVISYELFAYKSSLFYAHQRVDIINKIRIGVLGVKTLIQFIALIIFKNYYIYILAATVATIINNLLINRKSCSEYSKYVAKGKVSDKVLRSIKKKVGGMLFQKVGNMILMSIDTLIISAFLGLRVLAIYQNYYYIITSLVAIITVLVTSLTASVGNSVITETVSKNYENFRKINFIYVWIVGCCTVIMICMYQPFMEIWTGKDMLLPNNMIVIFAMNFFIKKWCDIVTVYQDAVGIWWETRYISIIGAIMNLSLNIILVKIMGLKGVLIATIITMFFIYNIGYAVILFKEYFKSMKWLKEFCINQIKYFITISIIMILAIYACKLTMNYSIYIQLIINGIIGVFLFNIIYFLFWRKSENFIYYKEYCKKKILLFKYS